jgi:hypothetical protein
MMIAGGIYTLSVLHCRSMTSSASPRRSILAVAIMLRLTMATGEPILEDDHYRYLWDGALVANGFNPYGHAPSDFRSETVAGMPSPLADLAALSGEILDRVNYPWLRSIYPPLAQAAFGLAHYLSPWSLPAWRLLLALFDLSALALLLRLRVSTVGIIVYGWNPLLIKEIYNSGHLDALMFPFLLMAAAAARRNLPLRATAAIGVASGIKIWPALLMPIMWRRLTTQPAVAIASIGLFTALFAAALLPVVLSGLDSTSGLAAYGRYWEMNDALYTFIAWSVDRLTAGLAVPAQWAAMVPRLITAAIAVTGIGWVACRGGWHVEKQFLMATTLVFLLSPTQFPWYYLWLLPFLALHPHPGLIFYSALLPLYYLRPLMVTKGHAALFDNGVVWIQHGPIILWLIRDGMLRRGRVAAAL